MSAGFTRTIKAVLLLAAVGWIGLRVILYAQERAGEGLMGESGCTIPGCKYHGK